MIFRHTFTISVHTYTFAYQNDNVRIIKCHITNFAHSFHVISHRLHSRPTSRSRKPLRLAEDILRLASPLAAAYGWNRLTTDYRRSRSKHFVGDLTHFYRAACNADAVLWWDFCPSVCPSVTRVDCDKTEERSVQICIPYERTFSLVFWEEEWLVGGRPLLGEILGQPTPIGAKSPIFNQ